MEPTHVQQRATNWSYANVKPRARFVEDKAASHQQCTHTTGVKPCDRMATHVEVLSELFVCTAFSKLLDKAALFLNLFHVWVKPVVSTIVTMILTALVLPQRETTSGVLRQSARRLGALGT
eukprot:675144-Pleurochrysis_carterae.AAC.1